MCRNLTTDRGNSDWNIFVNGFGRPKLRSDEASGNVDYLRTYYVLYYCIYYAMIASDY